MTEEAMYSNCNTDDTGICPLCGEPNNCAMAECDKVSDMPCWCKSEEFPLGLLNRIPKDVRNLACICQNCLKDYSNQQKNAVKR